MDVRRHGYLMVGRGRVIPVGIELWELGDERRAFLVVKMYLGLLNLWANCRMWSGASSYGWRWFQAAESV